MYDKNSLAAGEPMFRAVIEGGGVFTLKPQGNSMRPTIIPGRDSVSIVALSGRAERFDVLFYKRPSGQFVLHRVVEVKADSYTLCGDNQVDYEYGVKEDWVIGVVSEIITPKATLVRGTKEFLAPARRRLHSRPFRLLYNRLAVLYHKIIGK